MPEIPLKHLLRRDQKLVSAFFYHQNCADGFAAATVAHSVYGSRPTYAPINYGQDYPNRLKAGGKYAVFVDFMPDEKTIEFMKPRWKGWFAVDHHESRKELAAQYKDQVTFDLNKSGAMLTYEWLYSNKTVVPDLVRYVQDRDLWRWVLPKSLEINAWISNQPMRFEQWGPLLENFPTEQAIEQGTLIVQTHRKIYTSAAKSAKLYKINGTLIRLTNATTLISDTCNHMLDIYPEIEIAATFFLLNPHTVVLSMRAREGVNCIPLAQSLHPGGGGHPRACGVTLPSTEFFSKLEEVLL